MKRPMLNGFVLALVDSAGAVQFAEAEFQEVMRSEWAQWCGSRLPEALVDAMQRQVHYTGAQIAVEFRRAAAMVFVKARMRSSVDNLTPREQQVAAQYSRGRTYKEIAQALSVSPETVRKQIQHIYRKLEVSDKAELATLLASS